ncbi:MAG: hypothetical protein FJ217_08615 [Ignavibacteria bacterium]|nr:hypothetical protein [Ignavibacteria bacterium]
MAIVLYLWLEHSEPSVKSDANSLSFNNLPDTPGVYLFYGTHDELLYVGKSKTIRTRVRSHFVSGEEARLRRRVRRIEVRETAGELGALLLESQLIKELRPMFNVAARSRRRIIIARRLMNKEGYATVALEAVDRIDLRETEPILGIFKHKTQAKEYLSTVAKTHRLCPKLLRLESSKRHCFSYHLGQCNGACMGEEAPARYNGRLDAAFHARRIHAWPFRGGIIIEERSADNALRELFLVDNWCLLASFILRDNSCNQHIRGEHRFDYESYKILLSYLTLEKNHTITQLGREALDRLCREGPRTVDW